ncbi:TPA: hypothetical protein NV758_001556 [Escherichia coli]|nr:hypothetical protein [Escherichia coli]QXN76016.1 hypothetical protein [Escherichia phage BF17]WIL00547.1 hypothetical protein [Escherichia phage vB_EcoM_CRJP21]OTE92265.1 hypothetical protein B1K96_15490 [Escherichia coli]QXN76620.1 hypothetical protein [Escherichia phage BF17]
MQGQLIVRKWSDTNAKPWDVQYIGPDGVSRYQPGVTHSTEQYAAAHRERLLESMKQGYGEKFIQDHWLKD